MVVGGAQVDHLDVKASYIECQLRGLDRPDGLRGQDADILGMRWDCAGSADGPVRRFIDDDEDFHRFVLVVPSGQPAGCGALFRVSPGGVPALRTLTNLLKVSNQNGAPSDTARTEIINPNIL